jgi:hypothetical protein
MESPLGLELLISSLDLFGLLWNQLRAQRKLLEFAKRAIVATHALCAIMLARVLA